MSVTIYHNPHCSKSCATLQLLRDRGFDPAIVRYLDTPPDEEGLRRILRLLGKSARDVIRDKEYAALNLPETQDEAELIRRMVRHPAIIERPIVVSARGARIGRPPESVLEIL
jgi:arsenate reductase (glutaredoxin)